MMPEPKPLAGWTILSLRPQNQHAPVRRAAAHWQARAIALSAFRLAPSVNTDELADVLACGLRIATSPAAARLAGQQAELGGDWLAVGAGTARELFRAGARAVQVPQPQTADGLLALQALQRVRGRRIGLLTAPDGRGLLEESLAARGATLRLAHVYRREPVALSGRHLAGIDALGSHAAVLVTSQKAFGHIWAQLDASRRRKFKSLICVASSTRLVEYLKALGLTRVICSDSTLPQRQLSALAHAAMPLKKSGATDERPFKPSGGAAN
ncbi:MAG TPA: uroporphyrinogen-III synthase [Arenimonas sp.]|nr:uroporphyrinogen-III synthase [Arenimonas sp.]